MKILALDASTEYCSVALSMDDHVDFRDTRAGQTHSEIILRMVDELLRARRLRLKDLDGIAYGAGPGSFTGLRIACGVVQGLAFGTELPVVGVGTLLAMAAGTEADRVVCCLDARMQEIYHAAYVRVDGETEGFPRNPRPSVGCGWRVVHEPTVCAPAAAPELPDGLWYACGSGFLAYRDVLQKRYAGQLSGTDVDRYPHAREIARLALPRFEAKEGLSSEHAAPVYVRDKVALRTDERESR